jgi:type IV pilus assembly protein PilC
LLQVELSKFGFVFGLLVDSGITFMDALRFLESYTITNRFQKFYGFLADGVDNGSSFKDLFGKYPKIEKVFPRSVQNLITSAEKSGHLPETLLQIGEIYRKKLDVSTQTLSAIIEPLLIVVVWFFVLLVALAIIFPLYSIMGNINSY